MKLRTRRAVSSGILATKETKLKQWPGVIGDSFGSIAVPGAENKIYVRVAGKGTVAAFNSAVDAKYGLAVKVGYSKEDPEKLQILSSRTSQPAGIGGGAGIPYAPASRYRWMDAAGGEDPLYVELRQFMPLRPGMGGGMNLQVYRGWIWTGTAFKAIATQYIDLSNYVPSTIGKAALVLVTIDDTGTVVCTKGGEVDIADIPTTAIPTPPAGTVTAIAAVRVYYGQTVVQEARTNTDIIDLRFIYFPGGGGGGGGGGGALSSASVFLNTNVTLTTANVFQDILFLSLAAGTWLIIASAECIHPTASPDDYVARIWDRTSIFASSGSSNRINTDPVSIGVTAIVMPLVATTYYLSVAADDSGGKVLASAGRSGLTTPRATWINAVKIA